jgi:hypothetical protein
MQQVHGRGMRTWYSTTKVRARPDRVLDALTDPEICARWSGVDFAVDGLRAPRLEAGSRPRVSGRLLGRAIEFELHVYEAHPRRLRLRATGPIELHADYVLAPTRCGCQVDAAVSVQPTRGRLARPLAAATGALLSAGGLDHALARLATEGERARAPSGSV